MARALNWSAEDGTTDSNSQSRIVDQDAVKTPFHQSSLSTFIDVEVVDSPDEIPLVQQDVQPKIDAAHGSPLLMISIERYAFYERAKQAYAVIQTHERRFYGYFAFCKGVIPPADS